ncbi:MAG TPA: preprotein translocase subunit YajC [Alphaproteobacteria bacterium]|nr:preprotein translocase subunit YajC [Alphaproteobacteria bacterium]
MLITPAFAQAAGGGNSSQFLIQLAPFAAIIAIFYFLIIRPQQQRMKQHKDMVASVKKNDTVVTSGGIVGKVTRVIEEEGKEAEVEVQIAENTRVRVVRSTLSDVRRAKEASDDKAAAPAKSS